MSYCGDPCIKSYETFRANMRLIILSICFAFIYGFSTNQPAVCQTGDRTSIITIPETELRSIVDLRKNELANGSKRIEAETNYVSRYAIPLDQPEIYLRKDSILPEVPLVVLYFPASTDGTVRKVQKEAHVFV